MKTLKEMNSSSSSNSYIYYLWLRWGVDLGLGLVSIGRVVDRSRCCLGIQILRFARTASHDSQEWWEERAELRGRQVLRGKRIKDGFYCN